MGSDVSVKISKNGEAVTDIPGATVEIPYANRDSTDYADRRRR